LPIKGQRKDDIGAQIPNLVALAQVRKGSIIQNQVIDYKVILSIHFRNVQKAFDANRIHGQIDKTKLFNRKLDLRSSGEEHFDAILASRACVLSYAASAIALTMPALAAAQTAENPTADSAAGTPEQAIIVTGIRASVARAIDVKRNSASVVDAISAQDIGKLPRT
jgi:hypothetical protein